MSDPAKYVSAAALRISFALSESPSFKKLLLSSMGMALEKLASHSVGSVTR
jgi:hypothetical protein